MEPFRLQIGEILRLLCTQKEIELREGHAMPGHVHLLIPPKCSVANAVGFLKGKSAIRINRDLGKLKGSLYVRAFWSRGYCVSTVDLPPRTRPVFNCRASRLKICLKRSV